MTSLSTSHSLIQAWCLAMFFVAGLAQNGWGESTVWTLVIAVETYHDANIPTAPDASSHVRSLTRLLEDPARFPSIGSRLKVLAGGDSPSAPKSPTAAHIRSAFGDIARQAQPEDGLLVVLLLSGVSAGDEVRWLAADADPNELEATTILSSELVELMESTGTRHILSIIDPSIDLVTWGPPKKTTPSSTTNVGFRELAGPGRRFIASSNGILANIDEWKAASEPFFKALVEGLKGSADREGGEPDGWINDQELVDFVKEKDPKAIAGGTEATFWLGKNPDARPTTEKRRAALEEAFKKKEIDDREYAHGIKLLERMPRFPDDRRLRTAYLSYLSGEMSADDLATLRRQTLTKRNVSEEEGRAFGRTVAEVLGLIRSRHIHPEKATQALALGLRELADQYGDAEEPWVSELIGSLEKLDPMQLEEELTRFRLRLGNRPELTKPAVDICLRAALSLLDPYSVYLSPDVYRDMKEQVAGHFTGIGVILQENQHASSLPVLLLLPDGPAEKAGMKPGDRITKIDGTAVTDLGISEASQRLLGPQGSKVMLTIDRGDAAPMEVSLARDEVELESVVGYDRTEAGVWNYWIDRAHGIGYIRIASFASDTADRLRKIIAELTRDGLKDLVLDLRFNPGGLLTSAINVADVFITEGTMVHIQDRQGGERDEKAHRFGTIENVNLIVLVNSGSASGSEIVAAAIQDSGRGRIAGSRTFGKGSAQDIIPLKDNKAALKLTSEAFFRPNGKNLERYRGGRLVVDDVWGVSPNPDLEIPLFSEETSRLRADMLRRQFIGQTRDKTRPEDRQLEKIVEVLRNETTPPPKS